MSVLRIWLNYLLTSAAGQLNPLVNFNTYAVLLAVLGVLLILMPRGLGNKFIGCGGLLIAFILPLKQPPELQMLVFDVGQGTAILLRTPNHQFLYDTGPQYTENFDAGSALVSPYLHSQGLAGLDAVIVSHNDMDHSGGLQGILTEIKVDNLWLGEPEKFERSQNSPVVMACHDTQPWRWDNVDFRFITWPISSSDKANNRSCVLLVSYKDHKILVTGDIEKEVERRLVAEQQLTPVEVLLAPHHGSNTSSTSGFIAQTAPEYVIYSSGYRNQHGHPHKDVKTRYKIANVTQLNTALNGAIEFEWHKNEVRSLKLFRQSARRYWFDDKAE
ncbi:MAG: MBL fold metallo-hydrolase [Moraxellaceae bacterium]|nr:MAG: MBL fold metallo-hydrolase [Moraxellaceae bacterium]